MINKMLNFKIFAYILIVIASVFILNPQPSYAQPAPISSDDLKLDATNDQSRLIFFDKVFPGASENPAAIGNSPIGGVVGAFNAAVLFIGGIIVAYTLIAGTVNTAKDGEMLGRQWSSTWLPIRIAMGSALIMPIFGGFCAIQVIVLWLALQGAGLANYVWGQFADSAATTSNNGGYIPVNMSKPAYGLALNMFRNNVCTAANNKYIANEGRDSCSIMGIGSCTPYAFKDTPGTLTSVTFHNFTYAEGDQFYCGHIQYGLKLAATAAKQRASGGEGYGPASREGLASYAASIEAEQLTALQQMQNDLKPWADAFVQELESENPPSFSPQEKIKAAAAAYAQKVEDKAKSEFSSALSASNLTADIKKDGWFFAGGYYMKLVNMQDAINAGLRNEPKIGSPPNPQRTDAERQVKEAFAKLDVQILQNAPGSVRSGVGNASENDNGNAGVGEGKVSEFMDKLGEEMGTDDSMWSVFSDTTSNPIIVAKSIGDKLNVVATSIFSIGVLAAIVLSVSALGNSLGAAGGMTIGAAAVSFAITIWFMSVLFSVFIPMTPFIIWASVIFAYMIMVLEAIVASPLWAVAHLYPDGDGIVGRAGQGYMLVLGLLIRPSLMIVGMVCGLVIIVPMGVFLNTTFASVFSLSVDGSGPITWIAKHALYGAMLLTVVKKSFSLIHIIPDQVLTWMGTNITTQFGQYAGEGEQIARGGSKAVEGVAEGSSKALASGAGGMVDNIQRQKIASDGQKRQEFSGAAGEMRGALDQASALERKAKFAEDSGNPIEAAYHRGEASLAVQKAAESARNVVAMAGDNSKSSKLGAGASDAISTAKRLISENSNSRGNPTEKPPSTGPVTPPKVDDPKPPIDAPPPRS